MEDLGQKFVNLLIVNNRKNSPVVDHVTTFSLEVTLWTHCTKCLRSFKDWLPLDFKHELIQLLKLAVPVFISQLMIFLINFVSTVFCGHLGKTELAGVALGISLITVTGISIGTGLASACDTLISQTYGSGNLHRVGVILQRGILILLLACFPCWAVLINTEPILLIVKQSPEVARVAQLYVNIFMPALPAAFMYQLQARYLQNQGIIWPQVITGFIGNVLNAIINAIFLYALDLGVAGSAGANAISQSSLALVLFIFIRWRGLHKKTWSGWSLDCLREWGLFTQVAVPSMFMLCLEWWTFEIGSFLAGVISDVELAAQSVVYQMITIVFMFPLGFSVAATVRIGNALGAGNIQQAVASGKVSVICALAVSCFVGIILASSKDVIGFIFTTEEDVIKRVAEAMIICGLFHPADAVSAVTGGILRGTGKQRIGAICNLVGYYCIGLPVGVWLMFAAQMGILGLWLGLLVCVTLQSTFITIVLWKLNWRKAADEAMQRAGVPVTETKELPAMEKKEFARTALCESQVSIISSNVQSYEERKSDPEVLDPSRDDSADSAEPLLLRQLVLRRGVTVLFMVFILAAGIVTSKVLVKLL